MVLFHFQEGGLFVDTSLVGIGTSSVESASGRRVYRTGDLAADYFLGTFRFRIRDRDCRDQRLGIGVQGLIDDGRRGSELHHLAQVENADSVRDVLGKRDVVRYE